jgi:hypothetical protein
VSINQDCTQSGIEVPEALAEIAGRTSDKCRIFRSTTFTNEGTAIDRLTCNAITTGQAGTTKIEGSGGAEQTRLEGHLGEVRRTDRIGGRIQSQGNPTTGAIRFKPSSKESAIFKQAAVSFVFGVSYVVAGYKLVNPTAAPIATHVGYQFLTSFGTDSDVFVAETTQGGVFTGTEVGIGRIDFHYPAIFFTGIL